jgi:hypothetical protein
MKCRICGCEAPAGAKLCKDCAAARKRAFAATVTQPLLLAAAGAPSVSQPRFSLRPAKPKKAKPAAKSIPKPPLAGPEPVAASIAAARTRPNDRISASPAISPLMPEAAPARQTVTPVRQPAPRRVSRRTMLRRLRVAAGIAFAAVLLAIMVTLRRNHPTSEEAAPPSPTATVPAAAPATQAVPAEPAASATTAGTAELEVETPALPAPKPAPAKPRRKAVVTDDAVKAPKPEPTIVAEPAPPNVVAPQRVIDTARPDPLRVLNDALARCARGDLLNRPGCEQQARSQSCGNWWGQIPQCPIGPSTDHGQ